MGPARRHVAEERVTRFTAALAGARVDSCHRVWFELHEDLIATLGLDRHAHP
ncbi:hypothetical protein [Sphaerisporangium album]|uniref:hypothetical protein n=1 Tax=Sphaerisporangium album TaxID=509200 RepID=UPI001FE50299|nr:hypothetical protein [Sphaerisporangium album]